MLKINNDIDIKGQKMDEVMYGFKEILSFLDDYSGEHYILPEKAGDKAGYMTEMKRRVKDIREKFIAFSKKIVSMIPELEYYSCSNWINQSQIVEGYIWIELKKKEWKKYPQSVSISIEKHGEIFPGEGYYLSIRAETRDSGSKAEDYSRQLRLLDCEIIEGMTYLTRNKDKSYHSHGTEKEVVKGLCEKGEVIKLQIVETIKNLIEKDSNGKLLSETVKAVKEILPLYEYVMQQEGWWPDLKEYTPGVTAEEYYDMFMNEGIVKRTWLQALHEMYMMPDHAGTCKQMGDKYGYLPSHYISYLSSTAVNISKEINCPIISYEDGKSQYWPVLFQGKSSADKSKGSYCWKMREQVVIAMEKIISEGVFDSEMNSSIPKYNHNIILYGPPGTGKTYNSVIHAVEICEGKSVKGESYENILSRYNALKESGRIAFTTFHQSYGYEEFIEGIKPKIDEESDELRYVMEDGIFKKFCKRAKGVKVQGSTVSKIKEYPQIWGMILGGSGKTELKRQCFNNNEIRIGWSGVNDYDIDGDFSADKNISWQAKNILSNFKNSMEVGDIVVIEKNSKSIDAIGVITGDYIYDKNLGEYPRKRSVEWLIKDIEQDMVSFLPTGRIQLSRFSVFPFDYIGMDVIYQILKEHRADTKMMIERETKPYVFIIDEINRGNISKIFGELITLIEETKRSGAEEAMEVTLPYSGKAFSVPDNVYIIGTMNTADRSIALMDTALRRRFEFIEMMPDSNVLVELGVGTLKIDEGILNVAQMLNVVNKRIEYLFDREHTIGHAFFTKLSQNPSIDTLAGIFEKNVIPLLQEYFYEDYEKIQLVLGYNTKEDEYKFILDCPIKVKDIFDGNPDIDLPEKSYIIQHSAFLKLESYKKIDRIL